MWVGLELERDSVWDMGGRKYSLLRSGQLPNSCHHFTFWLSLYLSIAFFSSNSLFSFFHSLFLCICSFLVYMCLSAEYEYAVFI